MRRRLAAVIFLCVLSLTMLAPEGRTQTLPESTDVLLAEFVQPNLGATLDRTLTKFSSYGFSGTMVVGWGGLLALHKSYGFANREEEIPNTVRTAYAIGPLTMQFTAAAILRLEQQGLLQTQDLTGDYLGSFPGEKVRATIHHLLTHSAGLAADELAALRSDREEFIAAIKAAEIDFAPGTDRRHSPAGFILLAAIIEEVSGQSYESYLTEQIFKPAGMTSTRFENDPPTTSSPLAVGYVGGRSILPFLSKLPLPRHAISTFGSAIRKRSERLRPASRSAYDWTQRGASGIVTTAGDLFRWELALRGEKILSTVAKKKLNEDTPNGAAYGWRVEKTCRGTDRCHQGGATDGFESVFLRYGQYLRYIDKELVVIVLINNDMGWSRPVWSSIEDVSYGENYSLPFALVAALLTLLLVGSAVKRTKHRPRRRRSKRLRPHL